MITYDCAICEAHLDTGTRSLEKGGQTAANEGWLVGLPWNQAWCPRCTHAYQLRRVRAVTV